MSEGLLILALDLRLKSIHQKPDSALINLYTNSSRFRQNSLPTQIVNNTRIVTTTNPVQSIGKEQDTSPDLHINTRIENELSNFSHFPSTTMLTRSISTSAGGTEISIPLSTSSDGHSILRRSNSLPMAATVPSRRTIFRTLYESMSQSSPLLQNQKRKVSPVETAVPGEDLGVSASASPQLQVQALKEFEIAESKHEAVDIGVELGNSSPTSISEHSSSVQDLTVESLKANNEKPHIALDVNNKLLTKSLSLEDLPEGCPTLPSLPVGKVLQVKPNNTSADRRKTPVSTGQLKNQNNSMKFQKSQTAVEIPMKFNIDKSNPQSQVSPNSIVNCIHKRIQPGPSILRRKTTTPPPGAEITSGLQHNDSSTTKHLETQHSAPLSLQASTFQNALPLHKALSDSCIEDIQKLSLSEESDECNEYHNIPKYRLPSLPVSGQKVGGAPQNHLTRHISHEEMKGPCKKRIRFDPRVWVHEIQKCTVEKNWYNDSDMKRFKKEAILRIRDWTIKEQRLRSSGMIATGTGRIIARGSRPPPASMKALYTNPALSLDADEDEEELNAASMHKKRNAAVLVEIKTVLLVDCHDIFLRLLTKDIKAMMPHVEISAAYSVDDALEKMKNAKKMNSSSHGFDLIVVEHRLCPSARGRGKPAKNKTGVKPLSGANLIQRIAFDTKDFKNCIQTSKLWHPLVIGMSAYLEEDEKKLLHSGADIVWAKPPPNMNNALRDALLLATMKKRRRKNLSEFALHKD